MNPNWQKIFIKEAAVEMFTNVYKHKPNYSDVKQLQALQIMEQTAAKLIPIIQNLFN